MARDEATGLWALQQAHVAPADDRWVALTEQGRSYAPRSNARSEQAVLRALESGPVRQVELALEAGGVSAVVSRLAKKGVVLVEQRRRVRGAGDSTRLSTASAPKRSEDELTAGQREALAAIRAARQAACGDVVLVDGVTGSGKTEVYLAAIEETLEAGRDACVLVPGVLAHPPDRGALQGALRRPCGRAALAPRPGRAL